MPNETKHSSPAGRRYQQRETDESLWGGSLGATTGNALFQVTAHLASDGRGNQSRASQDDQSEWRGSCRRRRSIAAIYRQSHCLVTYAGNLIMCVQSHTAQQPSAKQSSLPNFCLLGDGTPIFLRIKFSTCKADGSRHWAIKERILAQIVYNS